MNAPPALEKDRTCLDEMFKALNAAHIVRALAEANKDTGEPLAAPVLADLMGQFVYLGDLLDAHVLAAINAGEKAGLR